MTPTHLCSAHIDRCPAVLAAGGDTAGRLRLEVERAEADRIQAAVAIQSADGGSLARLVRITAQHAENARRAVDDPPTQKSKRALPLSAYKSSKAQKENEHVPTRSDR